MNGTRKLTVFMMKLFFNAFIAILLYSQGFSQTPEQNLMKYWKHRERLKSFILQGENINSSTNHGSYLVPEQRIPHGNCHAHYNLGRNDEIDSHHLLDKPTYLDKCGGLNYTDQTMYLGWYIGVLATEYRLRMNYGTGIDGQAILEELWNALEAYERLDLLAETVYDQPPSLNGFFLRDDIMPEIADPDWNAESSDYLEGIGIECVAGSYANQVALVRDDGSIVAHQNNLTNDPWDVTTTQPEHYLNTPSADQALALMMGFALVKACVEPEAMVNGESVLAKAQLYADLMAAYAKNNANENGQNDWAFRDPYGNNVETRTQLVMYSGPFSRAARYVSGYQNDYYDFHVFNWYPVWNAMTDAYANSPIAQEPEICAIDGIPLAAFLVSSFFGIPIAPGITPMFELVQYAAIAASYGSIIDECYGEGWPGGDICWSPSNPSTLSQIYTAAAIANDWNYDKLRNQRAREWGLEIFSVIGDVLYNTNETDSETKNQCLALINAAPCDKFCACTNWDVPGVDSDGNPVPPDVEDGCHFDEHPHMGLCEAPSSFHCETPQPGWRSSHRYLHRNDAIDEVHSAGAEYPGLDFLLLYNVYHLKYPDELPTYYTNSYSGFVHDHLSYPRPAGLTNIGGLEIWPGCIDCEESPGKIWTNGDIWVSSNISDTEVQTLTGPGQLETTTFVGNMEYRAGEEIIFFDGFEVTNGASMHAYIDPFECEGGVLQRLAQQEEPEDIQASMPRESKTNTDEMPDFGIYPNPNSGSFTIAGSSLQQVIITDATGKLVRQLNGGLRTQVQIDGLSSGLYLVRAQMADGSVENGKVVVQ